MYELEQGSFFGEYNILYGLYSNIYYRTSVCDHKKHYTMIFRIGAETFMNEICKDMDSFNHINNIALQKFRFNTKVIKDLELRDPLRDSFKQDIEQREIQ